jgi:hypothetical protein
VRSCTPKEKEKFVLNEHNYTKTQRDLFCVFFTQLNVRTIHQKKKLQENVMNGKKVKK